MEALHACIVDGDIVDHRSGQMEVLWCHPRHACKRGADPGNGLPAIGQAGARAGNEQAGGGAVGTDEHPLEPLDRQAWLQRQRRLCQPGDGIAAAGDRLKPDPALLVGGGGRPVGRLDEAVESGSIERAAIPGGDHNIAAFKLLREPLISFSGGEGRRHPFHRRRRLHAEHPQGRRRDPGGCQSHGRNRHQAHRQQA